MRVVTIDLKENFCNALDDKIVQKTPVVPITTITLMEYRDKIGITFPEAHIDSDKMVKLASAPFEFSNIEGINIPFDMTIESEAIGCKIDLRKDAQTPEVIETPFTRPEDVIMPNDFPSSPRMDVLFEAINIIKDKYSDVPLIVGVVGPFTLLGQLLGIESLLKYLKTDYFEVEEAIIRATDGLLKFIEKLDSCLVDAICICEPSCSASLLNPKIFGELVKPELEYISTQAKSRTVLHVCGDSGPIIKDMLTCGCNAISIENMADLDMVMDLKKTTHTKTQVCGNISTNKALLQGTVETVKKEVYNALDKGIDVLCSSCSVPPYSPESNVRAMVDSRDDYFSNN